jgi:hypothetical protein
MQALIWIGAAVTLAGLAGLVWCIIGVMRARRAGLPDDVMRERLQRIVAWNLGALFLSVIGLMLVVLGIVFG